MLHHSSDFAVGNTRLIRIVNFERSSIYIKLEGENPTGSIKDRACINLILDQIANGGLKSGMTLLDASSGNMACSLAYFGRLLGFKTSVVVSSKLTESKKQFLQIYGANIILKGDFTIEGNQFCRGLVESNTENTYCFLDQLHNWVNPQSYEKSLGPEILKDCPEINCLIGSLGSGGSLYGTGSFLKQHVPKLCVIPVEAALGTKIPGTGSFDDGDYITPFISEGFSKGLFSKSVKITLRNALIGAAFLRDHGIFCGLSTGAAFSATILAVKHQEISGNVVVLSGDSGWKNMDQLRAIDPIARSRDPLDLFADISGVAG
jgi:[CysO sulfur-carrier protein]-thiocarboxylate-dependent cysteine synthase